MRSWARPMRRKQVARERCSRVRGWARPIFRRARGRCSRAAGLGPCGRQGRQSVNLYGLSALYDGLYARLDHSACLHFFTVTYWDTLSMATTWGYWYVGGACMRDRAPDYSSFEL